MQRPRSRRGIVLLITLFFIMAITMVLGVSLTQLKKGQDQLERTRMMAQSAIVLEDAMAMIKEYSSEIDTNDSGQIDMLIGFAYPTPFPLPLPATSEVQGTLGFESADSRLNINMLARSKPLQELFRAYCSEFYIADPDYLIRLLADASSGEKELYDTDLFDTMPWLYRERIVDMAHLQMLLDHYVLNYRDGNVYRIPWERLFRFGERENDALLDIAYVSAELWHFLAPQLSEEAIQTLVDNGTGNYDDNLSALDPDILETLKQAGLTLAPAPRIAVTLNLFGSGDAQARIRFEYDLKTHLAQRFDYAL